MTDFGEFVLTLNKVVLIAGCIVMPPLTVMALRERARDIAEARKATPSRSLLRRERPRPKRRTPAER